MYKISDIKTGKRDGKKLNAGRKYILPAGGALWMLWEHQGVRKIRLFTLVLL